jgi:hypothetical protein
MPSSESKSKSSKNQQALSLQCACLDYSSGLKMEAVHPSITSVRFYKTTVSELHGITYHKTVLHGMMICLH